MARRFDGRTVRLVGIGVLVVCALAGVVLVSPRHVMDQVGALRSDWMVLTALAGVYLLRPFVLGPMSLITLFVGFRYGLAVGFPIAVVGTAATTIPPYVLANRARTSAGLLGRLCEYGRRAIHVTGEFRGVVAARLSPAPADAVSYGAGASAVSIPSYVAGTVVGELPWTAAYLLIGASLQGGDGFDAVLDWRFFAGTTLAAGLVLAGPVYRWTTTVRGDDAPAD